jgi:hypothetical protein
VFYSPLVHHVFLNHPAPSEGGKEKNKESFSSSGPFGSPKTKKERERENVPHFLTALRSLLDIFP